MTDPIFDEMLQIANSIIDQMPPDVREALDEIVGSIARDLGESPEAWRGASRLALEVMRSIVESLDDDLSKLDSTGRFLLVFLVKFVGQPWAMKALEQIKAAKEAKRS